MMEEPPHPSLSRPLPSAAPVPRLLHSLHESNNSVLSLAADESSIFSGSQCEAISVWRKKDFTLKTTLTGHSGSILCLEYVADKKWLFSSSGDSTIRIWSTDDFTPLYVLHPYLETDAGDLFSLVWNSALQTIYVGCQNTSIQWFNFKQDPVTKGFSDTPEGPSTPKKVHKFFDSYPQFEHRSPDEQSSNYEKPATTSETPTLRIPSCNVFDSAHHGYVYCLEVLPSRRGGSDDPPASQGVHNLVSGSGDETVKYWECADSGISLTHTFECHHGAVLAVVVRGETIYAGCQDGYVQVWDLETKSIVRTIIVQETVDILSLSMIHTDLYTCSANGVVQRWSASFDCTASWPAHDDAIVLSSIVTVDSRSSGFHFITGGNDDLIKVWDVEAPVKPAHSSRLSQDFHSSSMSSKATADTMNYALSKFISIPSISGCALNKENCRQAAIWLKKCLGQLGASASMLPTGQNTNPLVLATFEGSKEHKPRILFYGHYDVISAPPDGWFTEPFTLTGRNGYLYGRGVTDNKGPIMAVACAAAELVSRRALGVDLVFLIEGEEESGSAGFVDSVKKHKEMIGHIDAIFVSNSTWIAEDTPCITYGLRGVIHCAVQISSARPDLHSGIEGGAVIEPMVDMVRLLATLIDDDRRVTIDNFYDTVRPLTEDERELYKKLAEVTKSPSSSLSSRWREPSLTIHNIQISGPKNDTVIPGTVMAQVSVRIVPDQNLETIATSLCDHLKESFAKFKSPNELEVRIEHTADWWLGDLNDPWFKALENSVREEWGVTPLRIREGGSIPSVPYLEKEFGCHALHLPLGQSSDQAHLPNERISLSNLHRGKSVIEKFLGAVAHRDAT